MALRSIPAVPALPFATRLTTQRWALHSQSVARRNAMTACTALAAHRRERIETEEFVAAYLAERGRPDVHHAG